MIQHGNDIDVVMFDYLKFQTHLQVVVMGGIPTCGGNGRHVYWWWFITEYWEACLQVVVLGDIPTGGGNGRHVYWWWFITEYWEACLLVNVVYYRVLGGMPTGGGNDLLSSIGRHAYRW